MPADTGYKEARAISEAAREKDWKLPSFGKALYLGHFQPELISPQPDMPTEAVEKGERFLAVLRAFLRGRGRSAGNRVARGRIPDEVVDGFKAIGALGMKVPEEYGGLGPLAGLLQPRDDADRDMSFQRVDAAVGASVDRVGAAAAAVRLGGAEARVAAEGQHFAGVGVRADRARSGLRPRQGDDHRDADRGRRRLRPQRPQAVDDQRDRGRRPRRDGQGAPQRGSQGRHHRVHRSE